MLAKPELGEQPASLPVYNLLNDLAQLARLLKHELQHGSVLNSYLLAVGIHQIVEDYLHPDPYLLFTAEKYLARMRWPIGVMAAQSAHLAGVAICRIRSLQPKLQRVVQWQANMAAFVQQLAGIVASSASETLTPFPELTETGEAILASLEHFPPDLLREVLRLPASFCSFDQQPADLERMVGEFAARWPDRNRPVAVLGIRTSGSYLAPLYAAFLKARSYHDVEALTMRPGREIPVFDRLVLQSVIGRNGLVLIADDPPVTGNAYKVVIKQLEHAGVPPEAIVLLLQLFGSRDTMPPLLREYAAVTLEWKAWAIHDKLTPAAVKQTLADLLRAGITVGDITALAPAARSGTRGHVRAQYRLQLMDPGRGHKWTQEVAVKGVGLGYFGEYALAVARPIREFLPMIYGYRAGLLYYGMPLEEQQVSLIEPDKKTALASAMATYVAARRRGLAVQEDVSLRLFRQWPVWEQASELLCAAFGRGGLIAWVPILHPLVKRLLQVEHASVIDGDMDLSHWYVGQSPNDPLVKIEFDERAFAHVGLACYDSIYDLAGLAMAQPAPEWSRQLRDQYQQLTTDTISPERWLIYRLVHVWDRHRRAPNEPVQIQRAYSTVLQDFFAETYFDKLAVNPSGPMCALDIDGVLETETLGFPGLTPTSALALRALVQHGYRPILATGRSLDEVRERCQAYQLVGGVAEYGAVVYNHQTGRVQEILTEAGRADLDRVRSILCQIQDVYVDNHYQYAVRAYRLDRSGRTQGLTSELIATVLDRAEARHSVRPIPGESQTDFMLMGIDKGVGLRALMIDLDPGNPTTLPKPLELAVGDTISDLPMFELAAMAFAPANADSVVKHAGITILRQAYQPGFAMAVSKLLGHRPGECDVCRSRNFSSETKLLLTLLALQEKGKMTMIWRAILLGLKGRRTKWQKRQPCNN